MEFRTPPRPYNQDNEYRKVGLEFEFAGISLKNVADIIAGLFGGYIESGGPFTQNVKKTVLGDVALEFDSTFLKEKRYEKYLKDIGINPDKLILQKKPEEIVAYLAANVVPFEVILPPIPFPKLVEIERFREALQSNKAEGTKASFFNAFGFHINFEIPDFSSTTVLSYLKAFLLLQYWIVEETGVDFTRHKISGYINDFPREYLQLVLRKDYIPEMDRIIMDYKKYNPTRNRPLDMYPLFTHIAGMVIVEGVKEIHLIKPRPAFHYRLPDCRIDDPDWRLAREWNYWVMVEELAGDTDKLNRMTDDFHENFSNNILRFKKKWAKRVKKHYMNE